MLPTIVCLGLSYRTAVFGEHQILGQIAAAYRLVAGQERNGHW